MKKITVELDEDGQVTCNGKEASHLPTKTNGRTVYVSENYVIKLDDRGYHHDDMGTWKRIRRADRKYFVPCLAQGYTESGISWSVQPFVTLDWDKTDEAEILVDELIYRYDLEDMHEDNWAMNPRTGEPIIFDYGME